MTGPGFLGTRADLLLDSVLLVFVAVPIGILYAIRLAADGRFLAHRKLQLALLMVMLGAVVVLELHIRFGGVTAAVRQSSLDGTAVLITTFLVHLTIAIPSLASWTWLVKRSWSEFDTTLPGVFSAGHKAWGRWTFIGVCLTSATGTALYVMGFAL